VHCTDSSTEAARVGKPFYGFWSSWRGWALMAALGGSAAWLAGCASRTTPAPEAPAQMRPAVPVPAQPLAAPQAPARNWAEYRLRAAKRLVAANPQMTYTGEVPEPLLAIPVLEIELRADGSVARIDVMRHPSQAKDTTQLAIDAVNRAAPFGDVSRLPKPWKFSEVFLFDDDRRFKPRSLDD
jgi:hypothetical protein